MRKPLGYQGINHETIGSDIISVLDSVRFPEIILGAELTERLRKIDPQGWYPIQELLDLMNLLEQKLGTIALRKMGRLLFSNTHAERVKEIAKSAKDIVYSLQNMYEHANRGQQIGGWRVIEFRPGFASVDKTTPHNCAMEEGILAQAMLTIDTPAIVSQTQCFKQGASSCVFVLSSGIIDERWSG